MVDWLQDHGFSLIGGVVVVTILWVVIRSWMHDAKVDKGMATVTAFCLHCNWEGRVARTRMCCGRCGSRNLSVIIT